MALSTPTFGCALAHGLADSGRSVELKGVETGRLSSGMPLPQSTWLSVTHFEVLFARESSVGYRLSCIGRLAVRTAIAGASNYYSKVTHHDKDRYRSRRHMFLIVVH